MEILLVLPILYILYFHRLDGVGLLGPDEPRYAAIGREMAHNGDWVTPRLWGEAWFEKPALLYWMIAAAELAGLPPRLPVALMGVAFLAVYFWLLREQWRAKAAGFATAILGTTAGWLSLSRSAVTDIPLAACFTLAMLLSIEWLRRGWTRRLWWAGVFLGLAVLAKGLVPLVLAVPLVWMGRRRVLDLWRLAASALIVAMPWYALCTARNGAPFLEDLILKQHFARFFTDDLAHVQPFWYYVPVMLASVFPWTPLLALLREPRELFSRFLWQWILFGLLFFSVAPNKLPGYILPLLPALCALMGLALAEAQRPRWPLAFAAAFIGLTPLIAMALPNALSSGTLSALASATWWNPLPLVLGLGVLVWGIERLKGRVVAVGVVVVLVSASIWTLTRHVFPVLDEQVSARGAWRRVEAQPWNVCLDEPHRRFRYGMNYYSVVPLPDCGDQDRPVRLKR